MVRPATNRTAVRPRAVRVFVSSTFLDMHAEREELVKRVFPQLRALCERRGVAWSEVDLRWGITDEQQAEGRVLPICLAEIDDCRPFFIGMLGERYGWTPEVIPAEALERAPWLTGATGRSLTEVEIEHGVLRDPAAAAHAYFYLRDPAWLDTLPADERAELREGPDRTGRLARLKDRIRASGRPVVDGYRTPRELGEHVLHDLTEALDGLYPSGSGLDPAAAEAAAQQAFEVGLRQVLVPRAEHVDRLSAHLASSGPPLLVVGTPGSGKSTLLAEWTARLDADPELVVVRHFVSASADSRRWWLMVRRILRELAARLDLPGPIPDDPALLRDAMVDRLPLAAARARVVLVIDGVDQLDDQDGALDLRWLPTDIPPGVQVVVSATSGRPVEVAQERGWATLVVGPLAVDERIRLVHAYLDQLGKSLTPGQQQRIAAAVPTANPLFLRTLLEELRVHGDHATLDHQIDHYLAAPSPAALYGLILHRYEQDYERDRPGLVGEVFSVLWAARRGLAEAELLDLLGTEAGPLPGGVWSPLFLAARPALRHTTELLGFAHESFRDAVRHRYLAGEQARRAAHRRLADHFAIRSDQGPEADLLAASVDALAGRAVDRATTDRVVSIMLHPRRVQEYPWQLVRAGDWHRLQELLVDPIFLDYCYGATLAASWTRQHDLLEYWAQIEAGSPLRLVDAYRPIIDAPQDHATATLVAVAMLLQDTEHPGEALRVNARLADRAEAEADLVDYAAALMEQALSEDDLGDPRAALALCRRAEAILRRWDTPRARSMLVSCLINLGDLLRTQREPQAALAVLREAEQLAGQEVGVGEPGSSWHNQALVLEVLGDRDAALAMLARDEELCRERGDLRGLSTTLGNRARLVEQHDPQRAFALLGEAEDICGRLGLRGRQLKLRYARARMLRQAGRREEALDAFRAAAGLARAGGGPRSLRRSLTHVLGNIVVLLVEGGELDAAREVLDEQEAICRELDDRGGLAAAMGDRALLHIALGEPEAAGRLVEQQVQLSRESDNPAALLMSLILHGRLLRASGDLDRAAATFGEAADLAGSLDDADRVDECLAALEELRAVAAAVAETPGALCLRANEYVEQGRLAEALALYDQAVTRQPDYAWGWADMGVCLLGMDRPTDAELALARATELGADDVGTWAPLGAARLRNGDFDGAAACLDRCIEIDVRDRGTRRLAAMAHDYLLEAATTAGVDDDSVRELLEQLRDIAR